MHLVTAEAVLSLTKNSMHTNSIPHAIFRVGKNINNLKFQLHGDVNKLGFGNGRNLVTMACDGRSVRFEVWGPCSCFSQSENEGSIADGAFPHIWKSECYDGYPVTLVW